MRFKSFCRRASIISVKPKIAYIGCNSKKKPPLALGLVRTRKGHPRRLGRYGP
jgi:hypothetical protein